MSGRVTALHGFLGLPRDWDFLRDAGFDVDAINILHDPVPRDGDILLGYSLGGRLALQALLDGAHYRKAVIVSARVSEAEPGRRERDDTWARRFETEDWTALMRDWNAQTLFDGHAMPRQESDFDRRLLARALREWSPAVLPAVAPRLRELTLPTLWIAGQRDRNYVEEGRRAEHALPDARLEVVPDAAHRVPWEKPVEFIELIRPFLG